MATYPESLWTFPAPNTNTTINLNNQGMESGDTVDQYLDQYWDDGVRVEIDPGTYNFEGYGLQRDLQDAALVGTGAFGDVIFDGGGHSVTMRADAGTVYLKNIEVRGHTSNNFRVEAPGSDAEIVCEHVVLPTGMPDYEEGNGFFACGDPCAQIHNGTLRLLWCQSLNHSDNGMYADGPSDNEPGDGRVVVVGGEYRGNNISDVRIGTDNTDVYRVTIHADGTHPYHSNGGLNARGLRIRHPGDNMYVNDCDIKYETSGGGAVTFDNDGIGSSGTIHNCRIENNSSTAAITTDDSVVDNNWTATDIHISGSGDLGSALTLEGNSVVGSSADPPDMTPWWGLGLDDGDDGDGSDGDGDDGTDDGSNPSQTNMVNFVFPEDTGTGASVGDNTDAANFATLADAIGHTDFVVQGLDFDYHSNGPTVDILGGKATISDTEATAMTDGEVRTGVSYVAEVEDQFGVGLAGGAVNHIWLVLDLTTDDSPGYVVETNESNAPPDPALKIGEINTSTNNVTKVNRAPVIDGQRVQLIDVESPPDANGQFALNNGDVYVQSGGTVLNMSRIPEYDIQVDGTDGQDIINFKTQ